MKRYNITITYYDEHFKEDVKLRYYDMTDKDVEYLTEECQRLGYEIESKEIKGVIK